MTAGDALLKIATGLGRSMTFWFNVLLTTFNYLDTTGQLPAMLEPLHLPPSYGIFLQGFGTVLIRTLRTNGPILAAPTPAPPTPQPPPIA